MGAGFLHYWGQWSGQGHADDMVVAWGQSSKLRNHRRFAYYYAPRFRAMCLFLGVVGVGSTAAAQSSTRVAAPVAAKHRMSHRGNRYNYNVIEFAFQLGLCSYVIHFNSTLGGV